MELKWTLLGVKAEVFLKNVAVWCLGCRWATEAAKSHCCLMLRSLLGHSQSAKLHSYREDGLGLYSRYLAIRKVAEHLGGGGAIYTAVREVFRAV